MRVFKLEKSGAGCLLSTFVGVGRGKSINEIIKAILAAVFHFSVPVFLDLLLLPCSTNQEWGGSEEPLVTAG